MQLHHPDSQKNQYVESLRGLAILLVVLFHALQGLPRNVYTLLNQDLFIYLSESFAYVRMPLFTVISGYVYSMRPVREGLGKLFLQKKSKRILLPFVVATALTLLARLILPTKYPLDIGVAEFAKYFLVGFEHLWYLPTIFYIFCITVLLEKVPFAKTGKGFALLLCFVIAISGLIKSTIPFHVLQKTPLLNIAYLLPYFVWGIGIYRFFWHKSNLICMAAAAVALVGLVVQQFALFEVITAPAGRRSALALLTGFSITLLMFRYPPNNYVLIYFSKYAFTIYLYHFFGISGGKLLLRFMDVGSPLMILIASTAVGLALPIALQELAGRWRIARVLVGMRVKPKEES